MKIDVITYLGAVEREVQTRDHNGSPARVVAAVCTYDSTLEDTWDAITSRDRIPRWFLPITGDLRLGGRYQLEGNAGGEILRCDPPRELHISWEYCGDTSWVYVRLSEAPASGTRLRLEHVAVVKDEFWEQYGPGAVGVGWDLTLAGLRAHLTDPASLDPKEAPAWLVSAEGKDFSRRSSEVWRLASIAAGTDPAAADAAAKRTTAAYTGEA